MRYTQIRIEGQSGRGATISPAEGGHRLMVEVELSGGGKRTHVVDAADAEDRWSMAQCLQETLAGFRGCGGDVRPYDLALQLAAGV